LYLVATLKLNVVQMANSESVPGGLGAIN
jgi:hypothetical protein